MNALDLGYEQLSDWAKLRRQFIIETNNDVAPDDFWADNMKKDLPNDLVSYIIWLEQLLRFHKIKIAELKEATQKLRDKVAYLTYLNQIGTK